ncbi:Crotonobetainyl-CoA:carnitine CoA-transferase CaiB [Parafrankia irregularis]|uniref:Crotonobetainyl-CoA:carnitine CoA-transferase CaiB n=1 Tax=Parafrankia irregularis TaxID=795642 RepID=A0A0S4QXQ6_9ACTN|nr:MULTISPECIES: CoA transferase [Parafrankia]CUU59318.1 Crotonobetainyl-CoA:carnitine CoA-transferase CaiB [Parafrankia irregularis]
MSEPVSALAGVRVLEASVTRAGRAAGMLLADLGADVVRAALPSATDGPAAVGPPNPQPESTIPADHDDGGGSAVPRAETLLWDRGKRVVRMSHEDVARIAGGADVLLVDQTPARLLASGLDAATLARASSALCHVWMPPYGARGPAAELAEDPLLLAALGGLSARYPATKDCPVAPVAAVTTQLHGALGAAAAVAALLGRGRGDGRGRAVTVSGLHAMSATIGTMNQVGHDQPVLRGNRSGKGVPFWRIYQAGDGRWLYLAALVPEIFFRALEAMDRMDILVLPGVDGDWDRVRRWELGGHLVAAALEEEFRRRPMAEWLALFAAADVPCAPIGTRAEWAASDIVEANHAFIRRDHPGAGEVTMPGFPFDLAATPAAPGEIPALEELPADDRVWKRSTSDGFPRAESGAGTSAAGTSAAGSAAGLPLAGLTIVDLSTFLAGPLIGALLADWGANVIKVEPPKGEPYRGYSISVLVVNQYKRALALDLARPGGAEVLLRVLGDADVFVENLRPGRLEKLGLSDERIAAARPGLVRCSVSAYGHAGAYADAPGFDPVFQGLSGLAAAQGGDGEPVLAPVPLNDIGTGALGALGVLTALLARDRGAVADGVGQRLYLSLANTATYLQALEFTEFAGRTAPIRGATDFQGPSAGHRFYQAADGWLAVAADTAERFAGLRDALGIPAAGADGTSVGDLALASDIAAALAALPVAAAVERLRVRGVPAVRALLGEEHADDPHLLANGFQHVAGDPRFGRVSIVRGYADWAGAARERTPRAVLIGHDTRPVLAEAGCSEAEVESLLAAGVVADIDLSDVAEDALARVAPAREVARRRAD